MSRGVPEGYHAVTPFVVAKGAARFLEFVREAFGGEETGRVVGEDGAIGHAEIRIGDSVVMAFDSRADWPATPAFLRVYVADGDAVFRRALEAGGTAVTEMTTMHWGDRVGRVRDPVGNLWWIMERVEALELGEIERRAGLPEYVEAMRYVQGAELSPRR